VNLVILGAPGSGKGTQAARIAERAGIRHISTGDLLRDAVAAGTPLGKRVEGIMSSGKLVPDEVVVELIEEKLSDGREKARYDGWVLDGFPRTLAQAEALDGVLRRMGATIDAVVYIDIDREVIVKRLSDRRTCVSCGAVYHLVSKRPAVEGTCDVCGGELVLREDDKQETVRKRLEVFESETLPILHFYEKRGTVRRVDGAKPIDVVTSDIVGLIGV
jgi:adenylate kinase